MEAAAIRCVARDVEWGSLWSGAPGPAARLLWAPPPLVAVHVYAVSLGWRVVVRIGCVTDAVRLGTAVGHSLAAPLVARTVATLARRARLACAGTPAGAEVVMDGANGWAVVLDQRVVRRSAACYVSSVVVLCTCWIPPAVCTLYVAACGARPDARVIWALFPPDEVRRRVGPLPFVVA